MSSDIRLPCSIKASYWGLRPAFRGRSVEGITMVFTVIFICFCLLQDFTVSRSQIINGDSSCSKDASIEDVLTKVKQLYVETMEIKRDFHEQQKQIERELNETKVQLAEAERELNETNVRLTEAEREQSDTKIRLARAEKSLADKSISRICKLIEGFVFLLICSSTLLRCY